MAVFASSYLCGDALHWYEDLDEDVQKDWSQLRPALLAKFGRRIVPGCLNFYLSITVPTPAAAPPVAPSPKSRRKPKKSRKKTTIAPPRLVRKGRLKVLSSNGELHGYIPKLTEPNGLFEFLCRDPADALLVSRTPSVDGPFDIQIIDASQKPPVIDVLAIAWKHRADGGSMASPSM
ncbi:hypothetical protein M407DRAFT_19086 [Tulasnella calospora MUT 4182]|uniref:Retrotransposon gag domain-containing protein n=1 Tax=Tulasnella calospora MUT 4182 TaxID=1051891 RepID=A0A0C3ME72_9AGAM|nr:hypothetical protein M407DRAFT_19086 [Tulasnella calospora MUT 4182]